MKININQLKKSIADAKVRQIEATSDTKRIEKDMNDFSNNKDSKLAELQSSLDVIKKSQNTSSVTVKTLQRDLQEARLESEQAEVDLAAAREQFAEVEATLKNHEKEIQVLQMEQATTKVYQSLPSSDSSLLIQILGRS